MKFAQVVLVLLLVGFAHTTVGRTDVEDAFALEKTIAIPDVPMGPWSDHMAIDLHRGRLFATPQAAHEVAVLDVKTAKVVAVIPNIDNPHGVFYDSVSDRLFVTDGGAGKVLVFDGSTFKLETTIPAPGADGGAFDSENRRLYIAYGGDAVQQTSSAIAVIDVATLKKVRDIRVDASELEGLLVDPITHKLYVEMSDKDAVAIIDLNTGRITATWPLRHSRNNLATALDTQHSLLYVGCRDGDMRGSIAVLNLATGQEVATLPIGGWVDSIDYDARRQRIYLSSGTGYLEAYEVGTDMSFRKLRSAETALMAKTSLYSPELDLIFVSVPHLGDTQAKILIFKPLGPGAGK
jgi:hypothetical protein